MKRRMIPLFSALLLVLALAAPAAATSTATVRLNDATISWTTSCADQAGTLHVAAGADPVTVAHTNYEGDSGTTVHGDVDPHGVLTIDIAGDAYFTAVTIGNSGAEREHVLCGRARTITWQGSGATIDAPARDRRHPR